MGAGFVRVDEREGDCGLFDLREVPGVGDDLEARIGEGVGVGLAVGGVDDVAVIAPDSEGGNVEAAKAVEKSVDAEPPHERECTMDYRFELAPISVSDVDRAKYFYAEKVGFTVDLYVNAGTDHRVADERRVVQLTPSGSAC